MSKTRRGVTKPKSTCPHCGFEGGGGAMKTYHFDSCKFNPKNNKEEITNKRKEENPMLCKKKGFKYKKVTCSHCNKEIGVNVAKRYHFNNCKFKNKL